MVAREILPNIIMFDNPGFEFTENESEILYQVLHKALSKRTV